MDFSRVEGHQDWQWVDLHHGIDSPLNIVNNEVKYKADLVKGYCDLPEVECLPSQIINQVILNIWSTAPRQSLVHLRPVLHHQADRQRDRARAFALVRHHSKAPRPHRREQRTGSRFHLQYRVADQAEARVRCPAQLTRRCRIA
jgi:hypothetical protein